MSRKPTFVLVPGNFLPPTYYASTASHLESHAFQTRLVTLPSTGSTSPLTSNEPDVLAVRQVLEELTDLGEEIIIVAHSYGGIPACEAIKGLGCGERGKMGKTGGVVSLVFIAAWLLREGEKPPDIIGRYAMEAPWVRFEVSSVFLLFHPSGLSHIYNVCGLHALTRTLYHRAPISSPTTPSTPSTTTPPPKRPPVGPRTPLTPTSQRLRHRSSTRRGDTFLLRTCCANWISVYCRTCRRGCSRRRRGW